MRFKSCSELAWKFSWWHKLHPNVMITKCLLSDRNSKLVFLLAVQFCVYAFFSYSNRKKNNHLLRINICMLTNFAVNCNNFVNYISFCLQLHWFKKKYSISLHYIKLYLSCRKIAIILQTFNNWEFLSIL